MSISSSCSISHTIAKALSQCIHAAGAQHPACATTNIQHVHAGGFNSEEDAARAHDVMAIKCRGADSITNYSSDDYSTLLPQLQKLTKVCVQPLSGLQLQNLVVHCPFLVKPSLFCSQHTKLGCLANSGCMHRKYLTLAQHSAVLCVSDLSCGQSMHQLSPQLPFNLSACSPGWLILQDEVRQLLMRKSSTFARGVSKYRGVTKHKVDQLTDIAQRTGTCHCHLLPLVTQNAVEAPQELCSLLLVYVVCCVSIGYLPPPLQPRGD